MDELKKDKYNLILWPIKFLWIIILLPKEFQFFLYLFFLIYLIIKFGVKLDKLSLMALLIPIVQFISIVMQVFIYPPEFSLSRLFAGINTMMIWFIAIMLFNFIRFNYKKDYLDKISLYMFINMCILFFVYILYFILDRDSISIMGYTLLLRRDDWVEGVNVGRFCAFMESVLGPSHLFCFAFPLSLYFVKKSRFILPKLFYCCCSYLPIVETNSRIGTIVCFVIMILGLFYIISNHNSSNKKRLAIFSFFSIAIVLTVIFAIMYRAQLIDIFNSYLYSRQGSTNTRFKIYSESTSYVLENSPLFGIGIKYMIGDFPLGSHSTYVGLLYKTGIFGCLIFLLTIMYIYYKIYKNMNLYIFLSNILIFVLFIFADIDGADWYIVSYFIVWGIYISTNKCCDNGYQLELIY